MSSGHYQARDAESCFALTQWQHVSYADHVTCVAPDGCRDFIVQTTQGEYNRWFVSELNQSTYTVPAAAGSEFIGLRLRPGVQLCTDRLASWLKN